MGEGKGEGEISVPKRGLYDTDPHFRCRPHATGGYRKPVLPYPGIQVTGRAPVWLYLKVAHALHGKARKLVYDSPVTGEIVIFDHSPD